MCMVDRLPVEIVGLIFRSLWAQTAPHPRLDIETWPWYRPVHPSVIHVSHICHRWRHIALDIPLLWSRFDDTIGARMLTFLQRSRTTSISLSVCLSVSHSDIGPTPIDTLLTSCRTRLRRLDVRLEAADIFSRPRVDFAAPYLEVLTIQCEIYSGIDIVNHPILLQDSGFSLRALALLHVRHWLPGNFFPNLTHLNISYFFMEELPLVLLTHLLSNCPRLQSLHLGQIWSYALLNLDLSPPLHPVPLPSLHDLSVCGATLETASAILSSLALPRQIRIRIHDAPVQSHTSASANVLPSLQFMAPLTTLELAADCTRLYLMAEGEGAALWIQSRLETPEPKFWSSWLGYLHEMLDLAVIHTFRVSLEEWHILPLMLERMTTLVVLGVMSFPDELSEPMAAALCTALESGDLVTCPALSTLSVQCNAVPDPGRIAHALARREERGCRISHLIFDRVRVLHARGDILLDEHGLSKHVDKLDVGTGGVCTWRSRVDWAVENEYWRLPKGDEPRLVFPWSDE